jgi:DNA-binding protein H-NS
MSFADLAQMQARIEQAKLEKHKADRAAVREKLIAIAKEHGFSLDELFSVRKGSRTAKRGKVAIKYRDSAGNTWNGRGRMPRWMVAATKQHVAQIKDVPRRGRILARCPSLGGYAANGREIRSGWHAACTQTGN